MLTLIVGVCGGLGAAARLLVDTAVKARVTSNFPWGTLLINVTGSFLLALIVGLAGRSVLSSELYAAVGIGFCGGYTTFSTASVEVVRLVESGRSRAAAGYALTGLLTTLVAGAGGFAVASIG